MQTIYSFCGVKQNLLDKYLFTNRYKIGGKEYFLVCSEMRRAWKLTVWYICQLEKNSQCALKKVSSPLLKTSCQLSKDSSFSFPFLLSAFSFFLFLILSRKKKTLQTFKPTNPVPDFWSKSMIMAFPIFRLHSLFVLLPIFLAISSLFTSTG